MRALLVPVKSFRDAKHRLASALGDAARAELARRLATHLLEANDDGDTFVACDDGEVADWAVSLNARVLWTPGLGLSGAVERGVEWLGTEGYELAVVSHADLPHVGSLGEFGTPGAITLAPDRRLDGTNVAAVPTRAGFRFAYGARSFARHCEEARRIGAALHVVYDSRLAADVDLPSDLALAADFVPEPDVALAR